ncbi:MAG: CarD family transcriptional regulator [Deltaproteobacteria bacterium]|nr:MAG: CarD family transcriptional regulator [Deltaproteobacteria bacterium]
MNEKTPPPDNENGNGATRFCVGDLAVYPAHGVGRIDSVESRVINGKKQDFYILKVIESGMTIMIPTTNVCQVGLRNVIDKKDVAKIFEIMTNNGDGGNESQTWNRRYREYMDKIKTGSLHDVAEVYRDLSLLKHTKDLSFGERKLYDTAQALLVKEISTAREVTEETVQSEISALFPPPDNPEN